MTAQRVTSIIFDLDGTLVDSLPGIQASLRWAIDHVGLVGDENVNLRAAIGPPIRLMMERLWPELAPAEVQRAVAAFRQHYDALGCLGSHLFEGVAETLGRLQQSGIDMFVLTNKPRHATGKILESTGIKDCFRAAISPDSSDPPFTVKHVGAAMLQRQYMLDPAATLVVGDGVDDAEAAATCGFGFVVAAYGYGNARNRADVSALARLETFSEIAGIVL